VKRILQLAAAVIVGLASPAWAQSYPSKPVEIIVPWGPGGGTDLCMRVIAKYTTQKLGVPVTVVNKPGGGGLVAIREVLTSATPDGYTLLAETHGGSSMVGAFNDPADVPFDWRKRTWIAMVDKDIVIYLVKADSPWATLRDVAAAAKTDPAKFRWSSTGRGGIAIPAMQQFFTGAGVPDGAAVSQVMFKSGSEGPAALAGGHVDFAAQQIPEASGLIEGKKLRAVAIVADKRLAAFPDVPTVAEAGFPALDVVGWHGLSGPPGLPQNVVDFWVKAMKEASEDSVFIEMLGKISKLSVFLGPAELKEFVEKEYVKYLEISKKMGWRK
jgi:tripartite-type tricarboxylate transporter receptor subunit TctC